MTAEDARKFAADWAAAWNALAIERVLAHFHDRISFTSPKALALLGVGTVQGKDALRDYWTDAISRAGSVRFTVERVLWDAHTQEMAIIYIAQVAGRTRRVSENLQFGADGLVMRGEVFHGVEI
jgi:ketosteroid isomerase-like protein